LYVPPLALAVVDRLYEPPLLVVPLALVLRLYEPPLALALVLRLYEPPPDELTVVWPP
jgi:hypothetical protein